jgi:hypothetical protein
MDKLLDKIKSYSFSDKDMLRLVDYEANLITYPEIANYETLDNLLGKHRACIILYLQKKNYGHWCCIFERTDQKGLINFYDPYGYFPDHELSFNNETINKKLGQQIPYLSLLMLNEKNKYKYTYNKYKLQSHTKGNNICGRVVGLRLNFKDFTDDEFYKLLSNNKCYSKDQWIIFLTCFIN